MVVLGFLLLSLFQAKPLMQPNLARILTDEGWRFRCLLAPSAWTTTLHRRGKPSIRHSFGREASRTSRAGYPSPSTHTPVGHARTALEKLQFGATGAPLLSLQNSGRARICDAPALGWSPAAEAAGARARARARDSVYNFKSPGQP